MAAIRASVSSLKITPPSAGWSWNATIGRPQPCAIASWYATGMAGVERRALVGRDREDEQAACAGVLGPLCLFDGLRREHRR